MKDISGIRCNNQEHTSLNLDDSLIEYMNQKLNYYKALQIAASLTIGVEKLEYKNEN